MITSTTGEFSLVNGVGEAHGGRSNAAPCPQCRSGLAGARTDHQGAGDRVFVLLLCLWAPLVLFLGENGFVAGGGLLLGWSGIAALRRSRRGRSPEDDPTVH